MLHFKIQSTSILFLNTFGANPTMTTINNYVNKAGETPVRTYLKCYKFIKIVAII